MVGVLRAVGITLAVGIVRAVGITSMVGILCEVGPGFRIRVGEVGEIPQTKPLKVV